MPQVRQQQRRRPAPLAPGFSQLHWMRLVTSNDDLTEGVGVADADEPGCKTYTLAEVRQHNTRADAWMVLRGRVYNVTRYLAFHPGSIEELMRSAGDDATELFDEVHPWVNASAMLETCCVGMLAPPAPPAPPALVDGALPTLHADEWRPFAVVSREPASADSVWLRFALPPGARLGCLVGEHLQLRHAGAGGKQVVRMYTPVSGIKAEGGFELLVRGCDPAALSPALCRLEAGAAVEMRGPRGAGIYGGFGKDRLRLPGRAASGGSGVVKASHLVCVSAGSGLAPTLFLLRSLADLHATGAGGLPAVVVVHASRALELVPGLGELKRLAALLPAVALTLALSADGAAATADAAGDVVGGRVDAALLTRVAPPPASGVAVLVCGTPAFNGAVTAWAAAAGHAAADVHVF